MMVYEQNRKPAFFPPFPKRIVPALPFPEAFVFFFIISGLLTYVKSTNVKFGKMVIIGRKKISALQMMIYSEIIRQLWIDAGLNQEKLAEGARRQPDHGGTMAARQKKAFLRQYSGVLYAFRRHPQRIFRGRIALKAKASDV